MSSLCVRRGECLSPILLPPYFNDMEEQLINSGKERIDVKGARIAQSVVRFSSE